MALDLAVGAQVLALGAVPVMAPVPAHHPILPSARRRTHRPGPIPAYSDLIPDQLRWP